MGARSARVVVDDAIAVVIDAVTAFGLRIDSTHAGERARLALNAAELTGSDIALAAACAGSAGIVVHHAIAVVVDVVAELGLRIDIANAEKNTALASDIAQLARHDAALAAGSAAVHGVVICNAVAVIVLAVADLGLRIDVANAHKLAVLALGHAVGTRRRVARAAGVSDVRRTVIGEAVAIVVNAVAGLQDVVLVEQIHADACDFVPDALGGARMRRIGAQTVRIPITSNADRRIARQIVGAVN